MKRTKQSTFAKGILYTRGASMSEDRWRTLTTIAKQALAQAEGKL